MFTGDMKEKQKFDKKNFSPSYFSTTADAIKLTACENDTHHDVNIV